MDTEERLEKMSVNYLDGVWQKVQDWEDVQVRLTKHRIAARIAEVRKATGMKLYAVLDRYAKLSQQTNELALLCAYYDELVMLSNLAE